MKVLNLDLSKIREDDNHSRFQNPKAVALGYFDGVHRGHQEIIRAMVQIAREKRLEASVLSFDRYPKPINANAYLKVVVPGMTGDKELLTSPLPNVEREFKGLLQSDEQRDRTLEALGVDTVILQKFDKNYASLSPEEFCNDILRDILNCKILFVGEDYHFGKKRAGNVEFLQNWCDANNVELKVIKPVLYDGEIISSENIRENIVDANMEKVSSLLGKPYTLPGIVIHGNALGRTIGMPTANIRIPEGMVMPKFGVYNSRTKVGDTYYNSLTSIGLRPTVNHTDPYPLVESYIIGENFDLYNQYVEIELLKFERPEERFPSFIAMSAQLDIDLKNALKYHNNNEEFRLFTDRNGIPIYISRSERFNTSYLYVEVYTPFEEDEFLTNQLLANVLTATTPDYPTRQEFMAFLDHQFASRIETDTEQVGDLQVVRFKLSAVNRGLEETEVFKNTSKLLLDLIVNPVWDEFYNFPLEVIEEEKQNMIYDYQKFYASDKNKALLFAKEDLYKENARAHSENNSISEYIKKVQNITNEDFQQAWMRMFSKGHIRVITSGRFTDNEFAKSIVDKLSKLPRNRDALQILPGVSPGFSNFTAVASKELQIDSKLSHLAIVFGNLPGPYSISVLKAQVLSALIAGKTTSLFNQYIKDELKYIYKIESFYRSDSSLLFVYAQVEPGDEDKALELMNKVVNSVREDDYSDSAFVSALRFVENQYSAIIDDGESRVEFNSHNLITSNKYNAREAIEHIKSICLEDLAKIAREMKLLLNYRLTPKHDLEDED